VRDLTQVDAEGARDGVEDPAVPVPAGIVSVRHVDVARRISLVRHVTRWPALPVGVRWSGNERMLRTYHSGTL
jgi:hypothetical protein